MKRFRVTGTGKVKSGQAGKRHGMIKRSQRMKVQARGMTTLQPQDAKHIKKLAPYGLKT